MPPLPPARAKRRICRCTPWCNERIRGRTRETHYAALEPWQRRNREASLTDPEASSDEGSEGPDDMEEQGELDDMFLTQNDYLQAVQSEAGQDDNEPEEDVLEYQEEDENEGAERVHDEAEGNEEAMDEGVTKYEQENDIPECDASENEPESVMYQSRHSLDPSFEIEEQGSPEEDNNEDIPQDDHESSDSENEWARYDEFDEDVAMISQEEKMQELEDILELEKNLAEWKSRNQELSTEDIHSIKAFKFRLLAGLSDHAFSQLRFAFAEDLEILSLYRTLHRVALLAQVEPLWIDCCPGSCIAYTGKYADANECPECDEARYRILPNGKTRPRRQFCYLPLIPRLQRFFTNPGCIDELSYRHQYESQPGQFSDVFDCEHYKNLCKTRVKVDGEELEHNYFSDKRDIAFSTCLDGFLLYKRKRGGPTATPILIQLYNLPPEIRTHLEHLLCVGIIPGPKGPKRLETFLQPLDDECATLAKGVSTFDCVEECMFELHGYNLFILGDIIAIEKFLQIMGHNSFFPCRSCTIRAVNNKDGPNKTYYVPLKFEKEELADPYNLQLRQHDDWNRAMQTIVSAESNAQEKRIAQQLGIKGMPALVRVGSLDFGRGVPWDYMHLLLENVVKNLFNIWKGTYKGLDAGTQDYIIPDKIWSQIGQQTIAAVATIPAAFVRSLGNPVEDQTNMTAEGWAFWFMYIAPILLKDRFRKELYYTHFTDLVSIMKRCTQFTLTDDEINTIETDIITWVQTYERIYYQYKPDRLPFCVLTIHGLLHITDNIRYCGPVWATWTFWMERYCGHLQLGLKSKVAPWAFLNNQLIQRAQIDQIEIYFAIDERSGKTSNILSRYECIVENYPHSILRPPRINSYILAPEIQSKIARYLKDVINQTATDIKQNLPHTAISWGKVRIANGGDLIRSASASIDPEKERDMSYVRYEVNVEDGRRKIKRVIFYGQLERVIELHFPNDDFWAGYKDKTVLLALLTPCVTSGLDAAKRLTLYRRTTTQIITDVQAISSVVGRVPTTKDWWGIIDRSTDYARTEFTSSEYQD